MKSKKLWFFYIPVSVACGIFYAAMLTAMFGLLYQWIGLGFEFGSKRLYWFFLLLISPLSYLMYRVIKMEEKNQQQ